MKKKVLSQINALANSIIASENEFDIPSLKNALIQLYEKLTILEFVESSVETEFEKPERQATDSRTYREQNWFKEPDPVPESPHEEDLVEPLMEKIKDIVAHMPTHASTSETAVEDLLKEILPKKETYKNDLEEFAASYQENPVFERKLEVEKEESAISSIKESTIETEKLSEKPKSINDKLNQGLNVGLNDRIAFIKHLFEDNTDDYLRVLSQINSMTSYQEASSFVEKTIKPDYNWTDKDEYVERFLSIIEKRFN